jgi:hypothetical protein
MSQRTRNAGEGPFGPAQTKLFKYILNHPKCSVAEIKENVFTDKTSSYVSNLLYENENLLQVTKFDNDTMPSQYQVKVGAIAKLINIHTWLKDGVFEKLEAAATE